MQAVTRLNAAQCEGIQSLTGGLLVYQPTVPPVQSTPSVYVTPQRLRLPNRAKRRKMERQVRRSRV